MKRVRKEGNNNIYAFTVHTRNLLKLHYRPYNTACVYYACRAIVEREISIILLRLRMVGSGGEEETRMHYIRHHISTTISIIIIIVIIVPMKNTPDVDDVAVQESQEKRTFGLVNHLHLHHASNPQKISLLICTNREKKDN